jgi:hypothetical protein
MYGHSTEVLSLNHEIKSLAFSQTFTATDEMDLS